MISGEQINLKYMSESDIDDYVRLRNCHVNSSKYISTNIISIQDAKNWYNNMNSNKSSYYFLITDKTEKILGGIGFGFLGPNKLVAGLTCQIFDVENQNKGYATEATKLLTQYLFNTYPINRIEFRTDARNHAIDKVAMKCDFVKEGIERESYFIRGEYVNATVYSILRKEWINTWDND